jgi:hypothetical protein
MFGDNELILSTNDKDCSNSKMKACMKFIKDFGPVKPRTVDLLKHFEFYVFDPRRYVLARSEGRYFTLKLAISQEYQA